MAVPKKKISKLRRINRNLLNKYKLKFYSKCRICANKVLYKKICNKCFLTEENLKN